MVSRIKPKIILDRPMLDRINEFYSARLGTEVIGLECFSDPQLRSHICSILALPENGQSCEHCKNVFGRQCLVTCHIHYFCLAVYAFRLGIGEKKKTTINGALKHNLKTLSYKKLHTLVMELLEEDAVSGGETLLSPGETTDSMPEGQETARRKRGRKRKTGSVFDDDGVELITITQAAEIYGCTYVNMYSHVRRGNVEKVEHGGANYVRKTDVEVFRDRKKSSSGGVSP